MTRNLQPGGSSRVAGLKPGSTSDYQDNRPILGHGIFVEESLSIVRFSGIVQTVRSSDKKTVPFEKVV